MTEKPWIAHSVIVYLPMSENWIWTQIAGHNRYRPLVLTKRAENLDAFPLDGVGGEIVAAYSGPVARAIRKMTRRFGDHYAVHRRAVERRRPVLLHSHFGRGGWEDLQLARRSGLPHVVSVYGADIWRLGETGDWRRRYTELFDRADTFIAEGSAMKRRMAELGCDADKIRVNHLGVNLERIPLVPRVPDEDGTVRCLMAGRAIEKKGMIYGMRAFANVAQRHPDLHLVVMTWGEAAYKQRIIDELKRCAEDAGVANRVTWPGLRPYDEYLQIIRSSHIFLVPSVIAKNGDAEGGCPVTAIELSASGMPIVGFDHCDIPEVVRDGVSGHLAPERDVDGLTDLLDRVVAAPDTWEEMGRAGRAHVEAEYNAATLGGRLEAIHDDVIAGTAAPSEESHVR
ncbi:MAG: glycosyltransferase [Planctomycetes bacterium]|nr:glycosyltransferase [Planctomycetota bacterium]